ncbi:hypothetical protein CPC08DRAFT_624749, partial [Agrocybe pediades]
HPPVTGYRLLVSIVTVVFGVAKMSCAYLGRNTSATTLDWVSGVIFATTCYVLGLYEPNNIDLLDWLFKVDYSRAVGKVWYYGQLNLLYRWER